MAPLGQRRAGVELSVAGGAPLVVNVQVGVGSRVTPLGPPAIATETPARSGRLALSPQPAIPSTTNTAATRMAAIPHRLARSGNANHTRDHATDGVTQLSSGDNAMICNLHVMPEPPSRHTLREARRWRSRRSAAKARQLQPVPIRIPVPITPSRYLSSTITALALPFISSSWWMRPRGLNLANPYELAFMTVLPSGVIDASTPSAVKIATASLA